MKRKSDILRKYLLNETDNDVVLKNKIIFSKLLNECCLDYDETNDSGKLVILKSIILMILKLMDTDKEFQVEVKPITQL